MFGFDKKYIYITALIVVSLLSIYRFIWAESPEDRLHKLSQELSNTVESTNKEIDSNLTEANLNIDVHLKEVERLQQCKEANTAAAVYNKDITVEQFLS